MLFVLAVSEVSEAQGSITPLSVSGCTDGSYVRNPGSNAGLVSDCKALVAVRNHWTGRSENAGLPGTHPLRTWGSGNSAVGSWAGVSVSGRRVIGVNLIVSRNAGASRISGTLPTQLGDLTRLRNLNLYGNRLTGSIPENLGDISSLRFLALGKNNLTGSIPEELGDLTRLRFLDLGKNNLTGSIPGEFGDLTALTHLYLDGNKLRGSIPEELGDLTSLRFLDLGNNNLTGLIPGELGDLTTLAHLYLDGNNLRGSIPEELGDLASLTFLHLANNNLKGSIPGELGDLTSLRFLDLGNNNLRGEIPGELEDLAALTHLSLSSNKLTGEIPEGLGDLTSLRHLNLSNNNLTGEIPEELGDLTALKVLNLSNNKLTREIPWELEDLTSLQSLSIGSNQLIGSVPEELGDLSPSQGGSLTSLYICRNMLSVTLPADLRSVKGDASGCAAAPAGLGATAGDGQVTLRWTDPGNASIKGYQYRVCEPGGLNCGAWTRIPGSGAGTVSYVADELENDEDYLFQLRAVNGSGPGMSAEVGERPGLPEPPTVDAGSDQTVEEGEAVTLSGSVTGAEGRELTYLWEQSGGTPTVTLSGADTDTAGFTAPEQLVSNAVLAFRLTVSDGVNSVADTVTVTVTAGTNDAPTAEAGDDQRVNEGEAITLSGSATDPENQALTYLWEQSGGTPTVTLSGADTATAGFTAPEHLVSNAALVFRLTVSDDVNSVADTVTITVTAGANDAPTADAGDDQTVEEGETVTLDGSGSSDPEGEKLTYAWTQGSGTRVTLRSSTTKSPMFTAPAQLTSDAVLVFHLGVIDARGLTSSADTVTVTVTAGTNDAPTADAGDDQTVEEGETVTLDGSGSSDPEGEALTYAWTQKSGPAVTLSSSTAKSPMFTAPTQLTSDAVYKFSLVVTDARDLVSSTDTVTVTVTAGPNDAPTADAGDDQTVDEGAAVTLSGSATDPEGEAITYAWTQKSGPRVTLRSSTTKIPTFTAPVQLASNAALVFSLVATDARGQASTADTVTVTVTAGPNDAPTAEAGDDQRVNEGAAVTLSGSATDPENQALTYLWEQTGGTPTVTLSGADTATASFTAPSQIISNAALVFRLTVSDGVNSVADMVTITVTAGANDAPTADAGDDQIVAEGATVTLDGSGSSDPEGEALTYAWTKTSGPAVTLSSSTAKRPTFTAPTQLASDAVFVFSLVVTDARGLVSSADTVTVTVRKPRGLTLSKTSMSVRDNGSSDSLTVRLDTRPAGTVTVAVAFVSSEEEDARLSVSSLTFTTSNWNINQTVTVTGQDDGGTSAQRADFTLDPSGADYDNADTVTVSVTVNRYVPPPPPPPVVDKKPSCPDIENKSATVATAFSFTAPVGTGGDAPLSYSATGTGSGISFNSSTRVFSGTPTGAGTLNITYTVRDNDGDSCSETFSIVIAAEVLLIPTGLSVGERYYSPFPREYRDLTWNTVSGATSYEISYESRTQSNNRWGDWSDTKTSTTSSASRSFAVAHTPVFSYNTFYQYRKVKVRACNSDGCSGYSGTVSFSRF